MLTLCIAPNCKSGQSVGSVFCDVHVRSPSGQRGGWLSAYQRKLAMVSNPERVLDASNIAPRLWMGSKPPFDRDLPKIDVLVLCARELQPQRVAFHGTLIRCPIIDDYLEPHDLHRVMLTAHRIATLLVQNLRVLVTCAAGKNRSGLVVGLALGHVTRMGHEQIVELIKKKRKVDGVLSNPAFLGYLKKYLGDGRPFRR